MAMIACSLQVMDVQLLKTTVSAMHGGALPDLRAEVARRCHLDIILNWSRKIIRAATPLADSVPREHWTLYTKFRPFFITSDDPEHATDLVAQFIHARDLDEVLNLFREEVARLDAERADDIIETAKLDQSPGLIDHCSAEEASTNYRAYLLHERRQLESLENLAKNHELTVEQLHDAGQRLTWRTCVILSNFYPCWYLKHTSLTALASRQDLGIEALVADPRGIYTAFEQRIPGLHSAIPYNLSQNKQTGLCLSPKVIPQVIDLMEKWPHPIMPHPQFGVPTPGEVQALREALIFASRHHAGLWEASDMFVPDQGIVTRVYANQWEREEQPERFTRTGSCDNVQQLDANKTVPLSTGKKSLMEKLLKH